MKALTVRLPESLKRKLDDARKEGVTAKWLIRRLLEQHFKGKKAA